MRSHDLVPAVAERIAVVAAGGWTVLVAGWFVRAPIRTGARAER
ncbi:hypothetical protein [Fodinicola feengrottensis]|nr:hypothetical protein [Fodinicola feengrottensis]